VKEVKIFCTECEKEMPMSELGPLTMLLSGNPQVFKATVERKPGKDANERPEEIEISATGRPLRGHDFPKFWPCADCFNGLILKAKFDIE